MDETAESLRAFTEEIAKAFGEAKIPGPVHLSGGQEEELIRMFDGYDIQPEDWVFSTYRSHYHALLHGVPKDYVRSEIMAGRSMNLFSPEHRFFTSAIVGGILPIAVGVAAAINRQKGHERVWVFVGDMAASIGTFQDAVKYSKGHNLPIEFIIEDNGYSCNSPTKEIWGKEDNNNVWSYQYERTYPHVGIGRFIKF